MKGSQLGLTITGLVETGVISLERAIELMTSAPARILNLKYMQFEAGVLREGGYADICIFDPKAEWTVDPNEFHSLSRNTPFTGMPFRGLVKKTIWRGSVAYSA